MLLFYPKESKFCFKVYFSLKYSKVTQTENLGKLLPGVGELFLHIKLSLRSGPLTRMQTGGHFAYACVHSLNDNTVGASNLMAGNRELA